MAQETQLFPNLWGIFDQNGNQVFDVDSALSLRFSNETKVSSFPVEKGSFASYNKVSIPYKARVRLAVGGDRTRLAALLSALETILDDTANLYHVVTPEMTYLNATVDRFDYAREHGKGQDMIVADVELLEVREVTSQLTSVTITAKKAAKKPENKTKEDTGKQQPGSTPLSLKNVAWGDIAGLARKTAVH